MDQITIVALRGAELVEGIDEGTIFVRLEQFLFMREDEGSTEIAPRTQLGIGQHTFLIAATPAQIAAQFSGENVLRPRGPGLDIAARVITNHG